MAEIIKMAPRSLHEQVSTRLRDMLLEGSIPPGAKLNERELSEQLGVSRTPLREAIRQLAAEGLIDMLPHRGAVAVKLTEEDVRHTFEVLAGLEGLSGELAAQRVSDAELAELRALHYEMRACHVRGDLAGYYRLNMQIHHGLNSAAKNPVLATTYRAVNARLQSLRFRTNQEPAKWAAAVQEHDDMIRALEARDGTWLKALLVGHLERKRDTVLEMMRSGTLAPAVGNNKD